MNHLKSVLTELVNAKTNQKIEIDPDIKIDLEDVYLQNQDYNHFVYSVVQHLKKYMIKFNMKSDEMISLFAKNIIDRM